MRERDVVTERVDRILDDAARLAYLREDEGADVTCIECGEAVDPEKAYSAIDPRTGGRGYVCGPCNFDPIHDQA